MIKYRVNYLWDIDDGCPTHISREHPLTVGEVTKINSFYHHIRSITSEDGDVCISVAQSAQSPEEAPSMPPYPTHKKSL